MKDNVQVENVEFKEELYQKNIAENDFSNSETDGIGDDDNDMILYCYFLSYKIFLTLLRHHLLCYVLQ